MVYLKIKNMNTYFNRSLTCTIFLSSNKNDDSFISICGFAFIACDTDV